MAVVSEVAVSAVVFGWTPIVSSVSGGVVSVSPVVSSDIDLSLGNVSSVVVSSSVGAVSSVVTVSSSGSAVVSSGRMYYSLTLSPILRR